MNLLWRVVFIMLLGAWIIWPDWFGLAVIIGNLFPAMPVAAAGIGLVTLLVVITLLPLSLRIYKRATQAGLLLAFGLIFYKLWAIHFLTFDMPMAWMISIVLTLVFVFIAWPMIANVLWQRLHYQRAVDVQSPEVEGHP